jgi:hypothetical protein
MFPATDIVRVLQKFPHQMVLKQPQEERANKVEEEQKVAVIEAKVVEVGTMEVAFQEEEVAEMIMVVALWALKTYGQIAVLELPVFVKVESQKQE